jgi:hypothetical protein
MGLGRSGIEEVMNGAFLRLYSTSDLKRLFERETGLTVDDTFAREFKLWLLERLPKKDTRLLPWDCYIWLIQKIHEYYRANLE